MAPVQRLAIAVVGLAAIVAAAALVRRDARRVGVNRPRAWAGVVAGSVGIGLALYLFVPTVPVPGLLVLVVFGPAFYLFERDDTRHGGEPADPGALPDQPVDGSPTSESSPSTASETSNDSTPSGGSSESATAREPSETPTNPSETSTDEP